jgi:hypothetical protein
MSNTGNVSFTIRRPSPVSRASSTSADSDFKIPALPRHLSANNSTPGSPLRRESPKPKSRTYDERDSSDEDEAIEDELVTGFDQFGVQRCVPLLSLRSARADPQLTAAFFADSLHEKPKPQGPLVIPAQKNRDWRELARKRKNLYVPPSAAATTGADGSVGGLGTRDTINSGPQAAGLQLHKRVKVEEDEMEVEPAQTEATAEPVKQEEEETEDQKALRALLAGTDDTQRPRVEVIPAVSEDDAFKQDVVELPESASLEDYERVPVEDFGAALLRGMGWKEGTAASRTRRGPVEPWLPSARPALLGIGAKEKEVFDDGSKGKKGKGRPDKRYVPVVKKERTPRDGEREGPGSGTSSRRRTPSPRGSRRSPSPERRRERNHDRRDADYDRDRRRDTERDRDGGRDREKERERDRDYDSRRDDRRDYDSSSRRDRDRNGGRKRDEDRSRRDRDRRDD